MTGDVLKFNLPHNSIIVDEKISVLVRPSNNQDSEGIDKISGLLTEQKYKSVELQHIAKQWRKTVQALMKK